MTINVYKCELVRRKLRPSSIRDYTYSLSLVEKFLGHSLDEASKDDIARFLDSISDKACYTVMMRLRSLKLYFKWLKKPEIADFPMPKNNTKGLISSDLLTEEEILSLINACDNPRDKALFSVLYDSACRKGEIIGLNIEDLVIESDKTGYILVDGKTGRRKVPLSFSIPALRTLVNCHPLKDKPHTPLFIATKQAFGNRLSEGAIEIILRKVVRRAGIKKRIFCHLFRHTRLTQLDKKGLSHTAMKCYAGWSKNSNMPSVYSHFSAQDTMELIYEADGIVQQKKQTRTLLEPVKCPKCETPNEKGNKFCYLCGMGLDSTSRQEFAVQEIVKTLIKTDPEIAKLITRKLTNIDVK